ncbi:MAG: TetR/AcrR family transcriptional regulator [Spirochaetota bacterium]
MGRREENNRRTKAAIVDNALRLFNERGYDEVTVEEITRAAGVAKGTFYSYFAVKSDIIVEEFWKIDRYYAEYASRNLRRYAGAEEKLRAFTRAQMRYVRDEVGNDSLKVLYVNQTIQRGGDKVIVNPDRQWYRIVSGVIAQGQETGVFRADVDAATLAYDFNRSMRSVFLDWCITDAAFDLVREGLAYLDTWLLPALRARR